MSKDMGIPVEVLVNKMYEKSAKKVAKHIIDEAL